MDGMYQDDFLQELQDGARSLVHHWGLSPRTRVSLLNISENATFRADDPETDAPIILRVHRPYYHTRAEIESELAWVDALRASGTVETPEPLTMVDGGRIAGFDHNGETRDVVAFAFMSGAEPGESTNLVDGFAELGAINARLHGHARTWQRPTAFVRKTWNHETTLGPKPHWGDWRAAAGMDAERIAFLERVSYDIDAKLNAFGHEPDRFGLIHADLRLANLLVDGNRLGVIDFDDCGYGWYLYDFAAAGTFLDDDPLFPELLDAWMRGYRTVAPISAEEEAMMPVFIMLRRILLTAWGASHAETPTGASMGAPYTEGTLAMAEDYMTRSAR